MWDFNYYWPRWEDKGGRGSKETVLLRGCGLFHDEYRGYVTKETVLLRYCGLLYDEYRGYVTKETVELRRWGEGCGGTRDDVTRSRI